MEEIISRFKIFLLSVFVVVSQATYADSNPNIRLSYQADPNLPDAISFRAIASVVAHGADDDPSHSANIIAAKMGLSNEDAADLVPFFIRAHKRIVAEVESGSRDIQCSQSYPAESDADANLRFTLVDDMSLSVYGSVLAFSKLEIPKQYAQKLADWIEADKTTISYSLTNHAEARKNWPSGNALKQLRDACDVLERSGS